MNALSIVFLSLIAVASSRVATTTSRSIEEYCERGGPNLYCDIGALQKFCKKEEFCKEYMHKSPCEKGPEIFCASPETARFCNRENQCKTWPDDSVTAVKVAEISPTTSPACAHTFYSGIASALKCVVL